MTTRSKLLLVALALATLLPAGSADAFPRYWGQHQYWITRVPIRNAGSFAARSMFGGGPCGLTMHMGKDGQCYIN